MVRKAIYLLWFLLIPLYGAPTLAGEGGGISDQVFRVPLEEGITPEDAIESMKLRANAHNFKRVAHLPLYKELQSMGIDTRRVEIFQFCDARIAHAMIRYNRDFAAYLPCRIALIEDEQGKYWLITLNLEPIMEAADFPPELEEKAAHVWAILQDIMEAGATGDL